MTTIWFASLVALSGALLLLMLPPLSIASTTGQQQQQNATLRSNSTSSPAPRARTARAVMELGAIRTGSAQPSKTVVRMGDLVGLDAALDSRRHGDLMGAAGEHKKYILVKKKPKHKKIKMEIYKPKMKYKKIKMKVPVKKMKKKKVKGYLVKKEKHYH